MAKDKKASPPVVADAQIPLSSSEGHWVSIREARWKESRQRNILFDRIAWEYENRPDGTQVSRRIGTYHEADLIELELWLTFGGSNLPGFEHIEPGKVDLGLFKDRLGGLSERVIHEWRSLVWKVNPDWSPLAGIAESA